MPRAQLALLLATLVVNAALWVSYVSLKLRPSDFGRVPDSMRLYALATAGIAYVCNLAFVGLLCARDRVPTSSVYLALACVVAYYALQLGFVPLVRAAVRGDASRWLVRALLLACVLPISILAGIGVELKDVRLATLGVVTALHVMVNDAIIFGFLF